ncbi:MAG TPA: TonB-dependent receptor plug domain-containing protein, partial [Xanthomonadaceae bacterium]|nr:TonB-dependent receptor plug domain-containing protein [Xanthomonadaceae bacterium]
MRLCTLPLLVLPVLATAQEAGLETEAMQLDAIAVTAARARASLSDIPASIDVVPQADIRRAQPRNSLAESLVRVPGVFARDRQNLAQDLQLSIRGVGARATFGVRGLRIYTDGIPASMPDGQGQVSHVALDAAQRIEVLRGPFSALYGNAAGGVIQVFSAPPPQHAEVEVGLFAGSDGMQHQTLGVRWPQRFGGMALDAAHLQTDGYRDHSAAVRDMLQWHLKAGSARTRLTAIAQALRLQADDPQGLTRTEADADPRAASPGALAFDTRKTVQQQQLGALLEHDLGERAGLRLLAYAGRRDTTQMLAVPVAAQRSPLSAGGAI